MVITPGKNFKGQVGFPTPTDIPETTVCRTFRLPDNDEWLGLLMGAVELLLNPHNFYNWGELSIDDTVDAWAAIVENAYAESFTAVCPAVPIPYWDEGSADDADDTADPLDQIWYGEIVALPTLLTDPELTFLDNVGIFAIAGFIAYAGLPGAAIAFVPIAKRFVLAFKQNSLGGVVKALVDFAEVAQIDTYGVMDGVANLSIVMPDDDMPHTLYVMLSDENPHDLESVSMSVIRKRLSEDELQTPGVIYDPDCDCIKRDWGDGRGFVDYPQGDPRTSTAFQRPPLDSIDARCDSAANIVKWIKDFIDQAISSLMAGAILLSIVNTLLEAFELLAPYAVLINVISDIAGAIFGAGDVALTLAFTPTNYELLLCALYCNLEANGSCTQTDLDTIVGILAASPGGLFALITNEILTLQGFVGVSNAAAIGSETGDCSGCDCGWTGCVDFRTGLHSWNILNDGTINARGEYVAGVGVQTTLVGDSPDEVYVYRTFSAIELSRITIHGHHFYSGTPTGTLELKLGGTTVVTSHFFPPGIDGEANDWVITWFGDEMVDQVNLTTTEPGGGSIAWLEFHGSDDTPPAWVDTCPTS